MELLLDIIIIFFGCICLLSAVTLKLNFYRPLIIIGLGCILLSILSFSVFPRLRIIEIIFIAVFLIYQLCNLLVHTTEKKTTCPHTICVPGAQVRNGEISLAFRRRLNLALDLYHEYNETPYIAICGGKGSDETVSEAQSGSEYLISNGVAPEKTIREEASHTTFESFVNLSRLLREKNSTVLIATSSYGVLRAALLAKKAGLNAKAIGCREPFLIYMSYSIREILAMIYNIVLTGKEKAGKEKYIMPQTTVQKNTGNEFERTYRQPVDYKQYDDRWAKKLYSSTGNTEQTMETSGCGPTACADVVATLIDRRVTPWILAELSMRWMDRTADNGTKWTFFKHIYKYYNGFSKFIQTDDIAAMKNCLDAGGYAVCLMSPGYWTKWGHFICAWKYDDTYIYCNDPASHERCKQKEADFKAQSVQYFCYYPY